MTTQRPKSISVRELSKTVDAAVKAVADKHDVKFEPGLVLDWTIIGRILREMEGLPVGKASQAAGDLTKAISSAHGELVHGPGGGLEPALIARNDLLICGFIARNAVMFGE